MYWTIQVHDPFKGKWRPYLDVRGEEVLLSCEAMAIIKARALCRVYRGVLYRATLWLPAADEVQAVA